MCEIEFDLHIQATLRLAEQLFDNSENNVEEEFESTPLCQELRVLDLP